MNNIIRSLSSKSFYYAIACLFAMMMLSGCASSAYKRSTQADELKYKELLQILPADADRKRLAEQEKAVKLGKYYTKSGKLVPLIKTDKDTGPAKLECRTCDSNAPVTSGESSTKPERKQPVIIKVE